MLGKHFYIFWAYTQIISAISSGATPIGSAGHAPDKKKSTERRQKDWSLWSATEYPSTASGATYIKSTDGAPNDKRPTGWQVV
jgi:hypothetical protein